MPDRFARAMAQPSMLDEMMRRPHEGEPEFVRGTLEEAMPLVLAHHKNEKPVRLMARLLAFLDPMTVCDQFMGSGTTGVAAVNQARAFIGVERESEAFDIACKRIEDAQRQGDMFI